jgi:chromosome segregation ATPase
MTEIPKYNFKKIEDLLTESSEVNTQKNSNRRNSQSSHKSYRNLNSSNNQSLRNTSLKRNKSKNSYTSNNKVLNTTSTTIKDYSSEKNFKNQIKTMENLINTIKENAYEKNKQDILDKTIERNKLKNNVDILETYLKLNRIAKTNFRSLNKGMKNENERLANLSQRASRESYYFNQLMPDIRKEVEQMKKEIEFRHEETKNLNNERMLIQKEIAHLHDEIKKLNWLNTNTFNKKEKIKNTLDLFKNHIIKQREKVNLQQLKTNELIGSLSYLAKNPEMKNN